MSIRKINNSDYKNLLISNLPTRPNASPSNFGGGGLSANQMKKAYDATPLFIIARFNELIDYINGTGDARLADDILNAIKGVLASKVETGIEGIATLSDLFASVESGDLAKAISVSDGKSLDETLKTIGEETIDEIERILAEYEAEKLAPIVEQAKTLQVSVESAQDRLSMVEKKVENLGAGLSLPIIEDTDVAYTKIVPDGALPYAMVAKVGGMSYKTKNLIPFPYYSTTVESNGVKIEALEDGGIKCVGTATANTSFYLVYEGTSQRKPITVGSYTISVTSTGSGAKFIIGVTGVTEYNSSVGSSKSFSVQTDTTFYAKIRVDTGTTVNATFYPMLNEGSTALPYSPYFEGLRHAKVTEIKSIGKNRAVSTESSTSSERGIEITRNIGKSYAVLNGTATADSATRLFGNFKLPVGTYTASVLGLNSTDRLYVGKTVGGGVIANYIQTNSPKTFTVTEETECFLQIVWASGSAYNNTEIKVQIERGNTATEYKPYTESALPIPSAVQALDGYGLGVDATAYNYIDWEEKKYYKNVGEYVFDGTENVTISPTQMVEGYTRFDVWKSKEGAGAKTDRCVCNKYAYNGANKVGVWFNNSSPDKLEFRIMTNEFSSSNELTKALKQWYAEGDPLTAVYPLAVPTETDISHLLPTDNFIHVEDGGTITAENEYGFAAPSEIIYQTEG